ncbi:TIGR03668 family PPOX class F420-dependent oxidoreductase [Natrinema caseinilyticum]|uniref:TIGR03668 family PPOX class F420-dependent oxidoreductase n=1 Tax=Natrinema caseinilyticum TaxID=2961570 RepID=UPI0020C2788F|nr:TIGR03668 family PPOX class F420-dependent oxidoreductase [Natrinema caseinilyticum]
MTPTERAFLERGRVAALATVDGDGRPHAVPICYALCEREDVIDSAKAADPTDGTELVSAIDEKPKTTSALQRVRNVRANPHVTVLVDRYRADWSRLGWVQVRGRARIVEPDTAADSAVDVATRESADSERYDATDSALHDAAVAALETKYNQYATQDLGDRPIISIRADRTVSWGALESD